MKGSIEINQKAIYPQYYVLKKSMKKVLKPFFH